MVVVSVGWHRENGRSGSDQTPSPDRTRQWLRMVQRLYVDYELSTLGSDQLRRVRPHLRQCLVGIDRMENGDISAKTRERDASCRAEVQTDKG